MNQQMQTPTIVRHAVVASAALMAVLLYLDRFCVGMAEVFIKEDLGLSDAQIGYFFGAFFLVYALGQVPSGWMTDRYGARIMLTAYILTWSLFTGLMGAAVGFITLLIARCLYGLGQAGAYPTSANLISKWVPLAARGRASSAVAIGGRVGGAVAPVLTTYLLVLLVPADKSPLVTARDVLNAELLARQLAVVPGQLPDDADELDHARARISRRIMRLAGDVPDSVAQPRANERASRQEVSDDLAYFLSAAQQQRSLYDKETFAGVKFEREAQRLLDDGVESLSDAQVARLNRFLLEGAYSESIRKLYGSAWRLVFAIYGAAGILVAAVFWFTARDQPSEHPNVNEAERALIERGRPRASSTQKAQTVPLKALVTNRSMWGSSLCQFGTNVGWILLVTWAPRYYLEVHQVPAEDRSWMLFVAIVVGWFGMMSGGFLTDALVGRFGLRLGRVLPITLSRMGAAAAYLVIIAFGSRSPWVAVAMFSVVSFCTDLGTASIWSFSQDVGGRYVGSVLGWGNMWGNIGAFVASTYLKQLQMGWNAVFLCCAAAFLCAGLAATLIDATTPLVPEESEQR